MTTLKSTRMIEKIKLSEVATGNPASLIGLTSGQSLAKMPIDPKFAKACDNGEIEEVEGGWLDSIPMLILSGQVRYDTTARWSGVGIRAMGDQEFDIVKSIDCMTKYSEMVLDPMRIRFCLEKSLYLAQTGRPGPCWLDIPLNVQGAYIETEALLGFDKDDYEAGGTGWSGHGTGCSGCTICMMNKVEGKPAMIPSDVSGQGEKRVKLPDPVTVEQAREILKKVREAKRPVINAGNGIRIAGAHEVFMRVVDALGIPVVTGADSIDCIWDEHPLYTGKGGNVGDRAGNFAIQNSDLLLSLGSRLSFRQVGYRFDTWAREAYTIINDIDAEELKKPTLHVDMPVHADVKDLLETIEEVLKEDESLARDAMDGEIRKAQDAWVERCQNWKKKYPVVLKRHMEGGTEHEANVYAFAHELSARLLEDQIVVVGNGSANVVCGHANIMKKGQRFISNSGIASMGYGLPASIGACIADHTHDIILVTGDGSIQMNLQELQTVIGRWLPIKIFVINNGGYHSIKIGRASCRERV